MKSRISSLAAFLFDSPPIFYSVMAITWMSVFCAGVIALSAQQSIHASNENIVDLEAATKVSEKKVGVQSSTSRTLDRAERSLESLGICLRVIFSLGGFFFFYSLISVTRSRRRAEFDRAALRRSEATFNNLVIYAPAGISKVDVSGEYEYVSQRWLRLTGLNVEQVFEKGMRPLVHPEDRDRVARLWEETLHEGKPLDAEYRLLRSDGTCVWVQKHAEPIKDELGRVTGYLGVIQDISLAKEKELHLRKAHDLALEAVGAKSRFLANMSHEIRTPLNGVIGTASLLCHTNLNEEQKEYVGLIRKSSAALLSVIDDILDYSKLEAGKLELESTEFDLRKISEEVVELLGESARRKHIFLTSFVNPSVPMRVVGDPHRTRQVLSNLVSNAIKFTETGEVALQINALANGQGIRIEVTDTGIGMTPEQLSRLFRPFSQADTATTRLYGGTGLGLSICKELVERMEGRIGASSIANKGSTFWVEIHLRAAPIEAKARGSFSAAQVSIFSDNEHFQRRAGEMLRARGIERVERFSIAAFWNSISTHAVGVTIVDWTSLVRLTEESKKIGAQLESLANLLVFTDAETRASLSSLANLRFLTAPLKQSQLYGEIAFLLGHQSQCVSKFAEEPVRAEVPSRRGQRLLVADDSPVNQRVIVRMLEKLGYEADVAADGRSAVAMARNTQYPAVLMDCHMPVMDGLEATKQIRQISTYKNTPIIALSADVLADNTARCEEAGMTHFAAKPLQIDQLKALLDGLDQPSVQPISDDVIKTLRNLNQPGSPDLLTELAEVYFSLVPEIFEHLQESLANSDFNRIRSLGHKLRGSSGHIGAIRMAELSYQLECLEQQAGKHDVDLILKELKQEFTLVHSFLTSCARQAA